MTENQRPANPDTLLREILGKGGGEDEFLAGLLKVLGGQIDELFPLDTERDAIAFQKYWPLIQRFYLLGVEIGSQQINKNRMLGLDEVNKKKKLARICQQTIADTLWRYDVDHKIKVKEMCDNVWDCLEEMQSTLEEKGVWEYLPVRPEPVEGHQSYRSS